MPSTVRDITGNPHDFIIIQELMKINSKCIQTDFNEYLFFEDFSVVSSIFNQKDLIEYMWSQFRLHDILISDRPSLLQAYIFVYKKGAKIFKYYCSNKMTFRDDIMVICYLNQTLCKRRFRAKCEIIHILTKIMKEKYDMDTGTIYRLNLDPISYLDSKNLTMFKISICFPSISLTVFYYSHLLVFFTTLLPFFKLPKMIFAPIIILILPRSVENPPFAILLAILVKSDSLLKSQTSQTPLIILYERILTCYKCNLLPECLKLHLCKKWNIVIEKKEKEKYEFIPRLTVYHKKAKNLIRELRPNDPNLENILSKI